MKSQVNNTEKRIVVAFHIGRGGRFNNAGHVTFIGEKNFDELIQMNDEHLFYQDRLPNGRFSKPFYTDLNGTVIVDTDEFGKETGTLNFDNGYDTDTCCYLDDCSQEDLKIIAESTKWKSYELEKFLEENLENE